MRIPIQGEIFTKNGTIYEIVYASIDRVRFSNTRSHDLITETFDDFIAFLKSGKGVTQHPFDKPPEILLGAYSDKEIHTMMERFDLIMFVEDRTVKTGSKTIVSPILKEFAEMRQSKVYTFSTFTRLYKLWRTHMDITCLLPQTKKRGQKKKLFDDDIEELISDVIYEVYLHDARIDGQKCYDELVNRYNETFGSIPFKERPSLISRSGFYRRLKELDQYWVVSCRYGKTRADKIFRCKGIGEEVVRPLQRVEADGNFLDVFIIDPNTHAVIGRPRLTLFIDVFTRAILGYDLSIGGFCAANLLKAFKDAINSSNGLPGGRIEKLYIDNGSDYISRSFQNACSALKIEVHHLAPKNPNGKTYVERFFKTLNSNLIHGLKGTTFSNPIDKGEDYNPEEFASLTLDELQSEIDKYIREYYHQKPHRSTKRAPLDYWKELNEKDPVNAVSPKSFDTICRRVLKRTINNSRVQFENLHYTSASLAEIDYRLRTKRRDANIDERVEVYIDESDLSYVLVRPLDIPDGPFIKAVSTRPKYTKNLSVFEHKLITAALNKAGKQDFEKYEQERLDWVRQHIRKRLSEEDTKRSRRQSFRLGEIKKELGEMDFSEILDQAPKPALNDADNAKQRIINEMDDEIVIDEFASETVEMCIKGDSDEK
jgi:putative transposase